MRRAGTLELWHSMQKGFESKDDMPEALAIDMLAVACPFRSPRNFSSPLDNGQGICYSNTVTQLLLAAPPFVEWLGSHWSTCRFKLQTFEQLECVACILARQLMRMRSGDFSLVQSDKLPSVL